MRIRLKPISSASPLLLFVVAMIGATAWLIGPVSSRPVFARTAPSPLPALVFAPRRAKLMYPAQKLAGPPLGRDIERLRRELEAAETEASLRLSALEASNADLKTIQAQIEALQAEIASLKAKQAALGPSRPTNVKPEEADRISVVVVQRREEIELLQADLARVKAPVPLASGEKSQLSTASAPLNKLPVPVELIHNQIAPVTGDFFKFSMSGRHPTYSATRSRRGETIEEAGRPYSLFGKFLSKLHPKREYLLLLVNSDSFESFYTVRDVAMRAGVEVSWQPSDTSDGTIAMVHVVPPSARHPGVIPLPDVVQ
jgi:hypothetical protein